MIDIHVHMDWKGYNSKMIVEYLDGAGVEKAWILSWEDVLGSLDSGYEHLSIQKVLRACKAYPDRFIPFAAVDPRRPRAREYLRELVEQGVRGYGEHKLRICFENPDAVEMFRLCGELNLPIVFHMDKHLPGGGQDWYNHDIDGLGRVLRLCPETAFIGHGPGFWRYISGDEADANEAYPKGPVTLGGRIPQMLAEHPNLYGDLSAGSGLNSLSRDPEHGKRFLCEHSAKLLYGTDDYHTDLLDFLKGLSLPPEVFASITDANARKLVPDR